VRLVALDIAHRLVEGFRWDRCLTVPMEPVVSTIPRGPNARWRLIAQAFVSSASLKSRAPVIVAMNVPME
jgi:hypothetical protein